MFADFYRNKLNSQQFNVNFPRHTNHWPPIPKWQPISQRNVYEKSVVFLLLVRQIFVLYNGTTIFNTVALGCKIMASYNLCQSYLKTVIYSAFRRSYYRGKSERVWSLFNTKFDFKFISWVTEHRYFNFWFSKSQVRVGKRFVFCGSELTENHILYCGHYQSGYYITTIL